MFVDMKLLTVLLAVASLVMGQQIGKLTPEEHLPLTWQKCAKSGTCQNVNGEIVMDETMRWLHNGEQKNCHDGGHWDATACPDPVSCAKNCAYEGITAAQYQTNFGVSTKGATLSQIHSGSRLYLLANQSRYEMLHLLGQEIAFDVDMSKLNCGLNAALYLVAMEADGGSGKHPNNKAGAQYGTGYCDAQCPRGMPFVNGESNPQRNRGVCCSEMDLWEANSMATVVTTHPCTPIGFYPCNGNACNGHCDSDGCGYNSYSQGNHDFYGPGKTVDTHKVMTVVTQFITSDGTANGHLTEIRQLFVQNGKVILNPASKSGNFHGNSLTTDFCAAQSQHGGLKQMGEGLKAGMVLTFALWEDTQGGMLWLDSGNNGPCPSAFSHEAQLPKSAVVWSNIKVGPINSTYQHA